MSMVNEPILLVDGVHGIHVPAVFCGRYASELTAQNLGEECQIICEADSYDGEDFAVATELAQSADEAWDTILDRFVPAEGYTLGYIPDSDDLFAIPTMEEK